MTAKEFEAFCDSLFPLSLAEEWDNVGLLVGRADKEVGRVLVTLDLTEEVEREAVEKEIDLIVAHHPVLFRGTKRLTDEVPENRAIMELVRHDISYIALHTNYDKAEDGVNRCLAEALGAKETEAFESGMHAFRPDDVTLSEFAASVKKALGTPVRVYGDGGKQLTKVCVLGGSGGDYAKEALLRGADAFVTGEISYHTATDMSQRGMCIIEAGHRETERVAIPGLAKRLREADGVTVLVSGSLYR